VRLNRSEESICFADRSYQNVSRETFWYDRHFAQTYTRKARGLSFGRDLLSGSTRTGLAGPARLNWRQLHHSRLFWIALVLMLVAVPIYVMFNDVAWQPVSNGNKQPSRRMESGGAQRLKVPSLNSIANSRLTQISALHFAAGLATGERPFSFVLVLAARSPGILRIPQNPFPRNVNSD
jgi:hypothetical protein